jgi:hypothetical protein
MLQLLPQLRHLLLLLPLQLLHRHLPLLLPLPQPVKLSLPQCLVTLSKST